MRDEVWCKHDTRSRFDPKMSLFLDKHGMIGYGVFWSLIEILHYQNDHEIDENIELEGIASQLRVTFEHLKTLTEDLIKIGLFQRSEGRIFQARLKQDQAKRSTASSASSASKSASGKIGGIISGAKRRGASTEEIQLLRSTIEAPASSNEATKLEEKRIDKKRIDKNIDTHTPVSASVSEPLQEIRPHIFLTQTQIDSLKSKMSDRELDYWLDQVTSEAQQNPKAFAKRYKNHALVIQKWRTMRLESGKIWDETQVLYVYPSKFNNGSQPPKSSAISNHMISMNAVNDILKGTL